MADLFADAAASLMADLKAHAATTITYDRPSTSQTASLAAGKGSQETEQADSQGVFERVESRDWIVAAADLTFTDGTSFEPKRKDTITVSGSVYEVIGFGPDGPVWEWSDRHGKIMRIHSQEIQ